MSTTLNLVITDSADDGEMETRYGGFSANGESGYIYMGAVTDSECFGFFRFDLPSSLAGKTITNAVLSLYGFDTWGWAASDFLRIWVTASADAPAPTSGANTPSIATYSAGDTTLYPATLLAGIRWPASGGLTWTTGGYNASPDISSLIQYLVDTVGLTDGHITVWIGTPASETANSEVSCYDYSTDATKKAKLDITYDDPIPPTPASPIVGSVFPENVFVEILTMVDGLPTWTNIAGDIVTPIRCNLEFTDNSPLSRLAPGSDMRFDIYNPTGTYDPSDAFYKGQKIRLRIQWGSLSKVKFFGYIDHIGLDVGTWGARQVHVTCVNWLALAAKTPIRALPGLTDVTIDEALTVLLAQMQIQPEALDVEVGNVIMPSVFDRVTENSTVYSELQNLIMGEFGYIYMRDGGMTLKVENSTSRTGDGSDYKTTTYYINDGVPEDFLLPDGTNFLLPDGTNFLLPGEPTSYTFDSDFGETYTDIKINHGDTLINRINASAVPSVVGTSTMVLYPFDISSGSKAFLIPTNGTYTLQGQYKDPTAGGAQISGSDIVTPAVSTDWRFNSKADGTGTDLSANITITFTDGRSGFKAVITNSGAAGYITKFNVRGTPVYRYSPVETVVEDQRSIWDYGDYSLQFTRQYGGSSDDVQPFIFRLLMRDRKPRTIFSDPKFNGFDTQDHLAGFLALDVGDQIRLASTKPASDALYYIHGVKFTVLPGNELITFDYVTTETLTGQPEGVTEIAVEQTGDTQKIDFGYLSSISDLTYRTICARFYISDYGNRLLVWNIDPLLFYLNYLSFVKYTTGGNDYLQYQFSAIWSTTPMTVYANNLSPTPPFNQWVSIAVTYDASLATNIAKIYENGTLLASSSTAGVGARVSEVGSRFQVGGTGASATGTFTGKYENIAIYNRILSTAEITAIHNGGTRLPFASYPQKGLKFFLGGMDTDIYTAKLDNTLGTLDTIYDLVNGFTGQPMNNPTLREAG